VAIELQPHSGDHYVRGNTETVPPGPYFADVATLLEYIGYVVWWSVDCKAFLFKEILVQDHFYRKYSLNHKLFELDTLCLPLLMMNDGAIAMDRRQ